MNNFQKILSSFSVKDTLNPKIWENPKNPDKAVMIPKVRKALMLIAEKFIDYLGDEVFVEESKKIAVTLSQMPTQGLALTKLALNKSFTNNWDQQLQVEDELQQQAALTTDYAEGINSFLEKRKPIFIGK